MNTLPIQKKIKVLQLLVEGNSIRSTERISGVNRNTIMNLIIQIGEKCNIYLKKEIKNIQCDYVQIDEIWTFVKKKQRKISIEEKHDQSIGSQYLFISFDPETKLIISYHIGKRNFENTIVFIRDLKKRVNNKIHLFSDGFKHYKKSIISIFGFNIDYAQLIKTYFPKEKYLNIKKIAIFGKPDESKISTSCIERQNLTIRMCMRRFTRKTNGFSKKIENLKAAVSLYVMYYNYCRVHMTLNNTPAVIAGITKKVWSLEDLLII